MGGSEEDGELKGKGEKWAVPLILNILCHGGLLIVQACRREEDRFEYLLEVLAKLRSGYKKTGTAVSGGLRVS